MMTATSTKPYEQRFSEVIYSSSEAITAQCYKDAISNKELYKSIVQGSIVKAISSYDSSYAAFGIITKINNSSLDTIHKPSALGLSANELELTQPQVYDLLRKELEIYLFAYKDNKDLINSSPPKPLMVHDFVYIPQKDEIFTLTENLSNIISIIKKNHLRPELIIGIIEEGYKLRNNNYSYLLRAGQELSLAYSDDIEPLIQVLKRLQEIKN